MKEPHELHTKRKIFAWLPVRRWVVDKSEPVKKHGKIKYPHRTTSGFYWLREVWQVRAGLFNEWTTYASHND